MKRALIGCLLGALIAAGTFAVIARSGAFPDGPGGPRIALVVTDKSHVTREKADRALPALQNYLNRVCQAWHCSGSMYVTDEVPPAGSRDWYIILTDESPCIACWGFHDIVKSVPMAYITTEGLDGQITWTEIVSHELVEMLVDPNVALWAAKDMPEGPYSPPPTFYALETADPVQGNHFRLNGYWMADFVYRSWFTQHSNGPYDYQRKLSAPFQLGEHGWAIVFKDGKESTVGNLRASEPWEAGE